MSFAGYYCVPENTISGDPGSTYTLCPQGSYCPNGTGHDWQPCPAGSYGKSDGLTAAIDCTACDAGMYCGGVNLTEPTAACDAGFYCVSGAASSNPTMVGGDQCPTDTVHPIVGDICPLGHFCEAGTVYPDG